MTPTKAQDRQVERIIEDIPAVVKQQIRDLAQRTMALHVEAYQVEQVRERLETALWVLADGFDTDENNNRAHNVVYSTGLGAASNLIHGVAAYLAGHGRDDMDEASNELLEWLGGLQERHLSQCPVASERGTAAT